MAKKKPIFIIIAVLIVVFIVVARMMWFSSFLVGEKSHDFGFVEVMPPKTVVAHTFTLTNKSGRDLILVDVVSDCGCTTTEAYQELIPDGDVLILPVQLKLKESQVRRSTIRLIFEGGGIEVLTLHAIGRFKDPLRVSSYPIVVKPSGGVSLATIGFEQFDNNKPPSPKFELPAGVTINSEQWKLKSKYNARQKVPANWSMQLEFTTEKELGVGNELVVTVGDYILRIPLVSKGKPPIVLPYSKIPPP